MTGHAATSHDDAADRVLDVWLEEVYADASPPDLTERILRAAGSRENVEDAFDAPPEVNIAPRRPSRSARRLPSRVPATRHRAWRLATAAAVLLALVGGLWWLGSGKTPRPVVERLNAPADRDTHVAPLPPVRHRSTADSFERSQIEAEPLPWEESPSLAGEPTDSEPDKRGLHEVSPLTDDTIVAQIGDLLGKSWEVAHVEPAPLAEDSIWCRRAYLRLIGRIPTVDELQRFLELPEANRRVALVDALLESPDYAEERAEFWAEFWVNVLVGRTGGKGKKPGSREALVAYLKKAVLENRPFDELVYELLSASGTGDPQEPSPVHFWLIHYGRDAVRVTDWATRVFWARPIGCVRCHDQFDGPLRQEDFWSLNAVLRTVRLERGNPPKLQVRPQDHWEEVYFERPDGRLAMAQPRLPDGSLVEENLSRDPARLRQVVARQFADAPFVARALVNRFWAHFLGFGFTRPVEDMAPPREVAHAELLEFLSRQVRAHGYDCRKLMRWIVLSDPFGRSSQVMPQNEKDRPESGAMPLFARYYVRPMAPEAVFQSLMLVAQPHRNMDEAVAARRQWLGQWSQSMETDEGGEHSLFHQGVQKSWELMNDPLMQRATSSEEKGFLRQVAQSRLAPDEKITHLFLAALARQPTKRERELARSLLEQNSDDPTKALEDIWWALLNSSEFLSDH